MNVQEMIQRAYTVTVHPVVETADNYRVSYVPRGPQQAKRPSGARKRLPEFTATAQIQGDEVLVKWEKAPSDPEATEEDFDEDLRSRVKALHKWIEQLDALIGYVHKWAEELGWATRRVYKPMNDTEIGEYKAPGLVLQRDMTRVGLEPVGRATSDIEGYVDLYVLPAYDDIAGLFFYDNRWHLSHPGRTSEFVEDKLFTKKAFRELLDQMTTNGG
jgi:hypothetical protein